METKDLVKLEKEKVFNSLFEIVKSHIDKKIKNVGNKSNNKDNPFMSFMTNFKQLSESNNLDDIEKIKNRLEINVNKLLKLNDAKHIECIYFLLENATGIVIDNIGIVKEGEEWKRNTTLQ